ncbi:hypothetical protein [Celerinatantimonas sp. YJH-8]|uniref:hypothetical protein n=1 Tax=Celerinatantimonas sp. YJH-8 TaxID=3228714 RepID=UPI0038C0AEB4
MANPLSGLKSLTNSGTMGGASGPATTGALYGGGARTEGITFGSRGLSGWWLIAAALIVVLGYWLYRRIGG